MRTRLPTPISGPPADGRAFAALPAGFGAAADEVRYDRARNGSRSDHPLHSAYIAKNEAASAWNREKMRCGCGGRIRLLPH
jgi:hypothetical protein